MPPQTVQLYVCVQFGGDKSLLTKIITVKYLLHRSLIFSFEMNYQNCFNKTTIYDSNLSDVLYRKKGLVSDNGTKWAQDGNFIFKVPRGTIRS